MPFIHHKLGKTYYRSKGPKRSIPLVCLHGGPGGTHLYFEKTLTLFPERRVIVYDQAGSGNSTRTKKDKWTIKHMVNELSILIDKWGLEEYHLLGSSWGGTLAIEYYLRTKDPRIKSLIFSSSLISEPMWAKDARRLIGKFPQAHKKALMHALRTDETDFPGYKEASDLYTKRHLFRGKKRKPNKKILKAFNKDLYEHMWGPSEFHANGTLKGWDRSHDLHKIKVPTLYICGRFDESTPESNRIFAKRTPNAQFKVIPKASHSVTRENPKFFQKSIRAFLEGVESK